MDSKVRQLQDVFDPAKVVVGNMCSCDNKATKGSKFRPSGFSVRTDEVYTRVRAYHRDQGV